MRKKGIRPGICFCWMVLVLSACSSTRSVPEGDRLFMGTSVKWEGKGPGDRKSLEESLGKMGRPSPNRRFLGMPVRLWLYNLGREPKGKGLNHLLRNKWGEKPVLLSKAKPETTGEIMESYLEDNGFFQARVQSKVISKGKKKAALEYGIQAGTRYRIQSVLFEMDSSGLGNSILKNSGRSNLQPGNYYSLDLIKQERERISNRARMEGYYYFMPDHLLAEIDSNYAGTVKIYLRLKDSLPASAKTIFRMSSITLFPSYNLSEDSMLRHSTGIDIGPYHVKDLQQLFLPKIFTPYVLLKEDSLYNSRHHERTLERLMSLGTFKFVKTEMEKQDSNKLVARFL